MATEERVPESAKALNKASRVVCESLSHSDSQHRPPDGRVKSKKAQQRPGNEMFVCFSPVPRPLLSPGREIVRETGRRKAHSGPVFSVSSLSKVGKKQDYDDKDPTSPKVTCIGQVRTNKKSAQANEGVWDEHRQQKLHQFKLGWASPARFFANSSKSTTWSSLFGSRKESSPAISTSHDSDVSCFRFPCSAPAIMPSSRESKTRGTFLAKFLILLQESDQRGRSKRETMCARENISQGSEMQAMEREDDAAPSLQCGVKSASEASDPLPPANALLLTRRKLVSIGSFLKRSSSAPSQDRMIKQDSVDDSGKTKILSNVQSNFTTQEDELRQLLSSPKSPKGLEQSCDSFSAVNREQRKCAERPQGSAVPEFCGSQEKVTVDATSEATSEQKDIYVQVCQRPVDGMERETEVNKETRNVALAPPPSSPRAVRLRKCDWETLKISVDVVPETWLWKDHGVVPLDGGEEPSSSRNVEDVPKVGEETKVVESGYGMHNSVGIDIGKAATESCTGEYLFRSEPGGCEEQRICNQSPNDKDRFYNSASQNESHYLSHFETGCRNLNVDQPLGLGVAANSRQCTKDTECFKLEKHEYFSGLNERSLKPDVEKPDRIPKGKPFSDETEGNGMEEQRYLFAFSGGNADFIQSDVGSNKRDCECVNLEKNYRLDLSDFNDNSLHARNTQQTKNERSHRTTEAIKEKKDDVLCPQSPKTVIFLGYKLETLSFSFNHVNDRQFNGEKGQKRNDPPERFEVGRLSFKGTGTYSQWSRGGTEILHSCSPTSHSTVIRLKRSNSEPWRPAS